MLLEVGFDNFVKLPLPNRRLLRQLFGRMEAITVFDIGACEGEDSIRYANFFPLCSVHSFEPIHENFLLASSNIKHHELTKRIALNECALSDTNGKAVIHKSSGQPDDVKPKGDWNYGNKSSSLLAPEKALDVTPWLKFDSTESVKTMTLDTYCTNKNIKSIDLIHMDVQGAEMMVLKGAKKLIKHISAIWLEVESVELYKDQALKPEIETFMEKAGFVRIVDTVDAVAGDQLYVKAALLSKLSPTKKRSLADKVYISKHHLLELKPDDIPQVLLTPANHKWMFSENVYYEKNVVYWFEKILGAIGTRKQAAFYDVGANSGYYSLLASQAVTQTYLFEPDKDSSKIIDINLKYNAIQDARVLHFGLGSKEETLEFHSYSSSGNNSFIKRNIPEGHELKYKKTTKVEVKTLDAAIKTFDMVPPNFVKVDVEGAELFVLQGAAATLKKYKPYIVIEYSEATSNDAGYKREEIAYFLRGLGYDIYGLHEDNVSLGLMPFDFSKPLPNAASNLLAFPKTSEAKKLLSMS